MGATQRVVGDNPHAHTHPALVHTHDHFHIAHHRRGGLLGEFEHLTEYHEHEHTHPELVHAHEGRTVETEAEEHDATAHTHSHA